MEKEKKKLLLVAVSVGVFLVIIISAGILILTPKAPAGGAVFSSSQPIPAGSIGNLNDSEGRGFNSISFGQPVLAEQPVVNAAPENNFYNNGTDSEAAGVNGDARVTISIPKPTTAAVPDVPSVSIAPSAGKPAATVAKPVSSAAVPAAAPKPAAAATPAAARPAASSTPASRPAASSSQPKTRNDYWVQTGAFTALVRAEGVKDTLASKGITSIIENREVEGRDWYRVRVGPYTTETEANYWLALVKAIDGFADSQVRQTVSAR